MQESGEIVLLKWRFHWYIFYNLHLIVIGVGKRDDYKDVDECMRGTKSI